MREKGESEMSLLLLLKNVGVDVGVGCCDYCGGGESERNRETARRDILDERLGLNFFWGEES